MPGSRTWGGGGTANRVPPPLPHQLFPPFPSQKKTTTDSARLHRAQVAPPPPPPPPTPHHTPMHIRWPAPTTLLSSPNLTYVDPQLARGPTAHEEVFRPLSTRTARTPEDTDTNGCREVGLGEGGGPLTASHPPYPTNCSPPFPATLAPPSPSPHTS